MKKVLFYGNCQMGAISDIFNTHTGIRNQFEFLNANDYNLPSQGYHAISHFQLYHDNHRKEDLEKIFDDADIVIFQSLVSQSHIVDRPEYALTENIIPNFDGQSICIPSMWYAGHFGIPYPVHMMDLFLYFQNKI